MTVRIPAVLLLALTTAAAAPAAVSRRATPPRPDGPAPAYADGAPPGFSGGFGELSCHACHFQAEPNAPPGRVSIDGVPQIFAPGQQYSLTVTLARPGMRAGGFQLTARFADGGRQAGTLTAKGDGRVRVEKSGDILYANQKAKGTALVGPDRAEWTLSWTAPEAGGPVQFHVSANAADADGSASGDYVYTATVETTPAGR